VNFTVEGTNTYGKGDSSEIRKIDNKKLVEYLLNQVEGLEQKFSRFYGC
jgi:hypothetical protein